MNVQIADTSVLAELQWVVMVLVKVEEEAHQLLLNHIAENELPYSQGSIYPFRQR